MTAMNQRMDQHQVRRRLLAVTAAWLGLGAPGVRAAQVSALSAWMPYPADQIGRIEPRLTAPRQAGQSLPSAQVRQVRIAPRITQDFEPEVQTRARLRHLPGPAGASGASGTSGTAGQARLPPLRENPPRAYVRTGERFGIPPWLLYGVALQESQLKFGNRALPYPWTLCVRGQGQRFASYKDTLAALKRHVNAHITNVDCGAMQVNWHWHHDKLLSFERALDPYPNLAVGAQILRGHFDARGDWHQAIALYHTGSNGTAEQRRRGRRYAESTLKRLARLGVDVPGLLTGGARRA